MNRSFLSSHRKPLVLQGLAVLVGFVFALRLLRPLTRKKVVLYEGKTALITGASAGIGYEIALELAARKASKIIVVARREKELNELKDKIHELTNNKTQVIVETCDLANWEAVENLGLQAVQQHSPIDILVNNAGATQLGLFDVTDMKAYKQTVDLNVTSVLSLTRAVLPSMIQRKSGAILNIGSLAGFEYMPYFSVYVGTKHFINGWTESLRGDLAGTGVILTQCCPGMVSNDFMKNAKLDEEVYPMKDTGFLMIDSATVAKEAIDGLEYGKELVIPGRIINIIRRITSLIPMSIWRGIVKQMGAQVRARYEKKLAKEGPQASSS